MIDLDGKLFCGRCGKYQPCNCYVSQHQAAPSPRFATLFTDAIKAYPELFLGGNDTSGQTALTHFLCDIYLSRITDEDNPTELTPQKLKRMERAFRLAINSWYEEQAPSQEVEHHCQYREALDTAHKVFAAECDQMKAAMSQPDEKK